MKHIIYVAYTFICISAAAQKKESFYDYNWKPCASTEARFYSTIEKTADGFVKIISLEQ